MPELKCWIDDLIRLVPVVLLAAFGGAVACLNRPGHKFSWCFLLVGIFTAGFVGLVVHCLLASAPLAPGLKSAAIAISGYAANDVLLVLKRKFMERLKS